MDLLVVGIDGGDKEIFEHMNMPFLNSLLEKEQYVKVEEDLWSRGWVNILAGKHVSETGGAYAKPVIDKTQEYSSTQNFGKDDYYNKKAVTPIWDLINKRGKSVGMMNWPTTGPASPINGFYVAGAGGGSGKSGVEQVPQKAVYPDEIMEVLKQNDYVFDTRFIASKIRQYTPYIQRLQKMQTNRSKAFINLSRIHDVEVGMICFRASTMLQYLAMYDIKSIMKRGAESKVQKKIIDFYKNFDNSLKYLFHELSPKNYLLVADHGSEPRKGTINLNNFLAEKGYLVWDDFFKKNYKRVTNQLLGTNHKLKIQKNKTVAFTHRYISGLYINDRKRFGGPIKENEIDSVVDEIVEVFNSYPKSKEHKLIARPYRRNYKNAFKYDLLPDVWVDRPDSLFFEAEGDFVQKNEEYGPLNESLGHVTRDQHTGTKGRYPLFLCSSGLSKHIKEDDAKDLTLAYKIIDRFTG